MPSPTTSHPRRRDGDKAIEAVLLDVVAWANEATESDIAALLSRLRTGLADAAKAELRALEHELRDRDLTVVERERQRSARHQQLTETSERKLGALSTLLQATLARHRR